MSNPPDAKMPQKVLYAANDLAGTKEAFSLMEKNGIRNTTAIDLSSALYILNGQFVEVIIITQEFHELKGIAVAQKVRDHSLPDKASTGVVLMQGRSEIPKGEMMLQSELGGIINLNFPFKPIQLLTACIKAAAWRRQEIAFRDLNSKVLDYHRKSGNFEKAVEAVKQKMPELGSRGPRLLLDLYKEAEKFDDALSLVDGMIGRSDKKDINLINTKGMLLMKLGRFEEAKVCLDEADQLAPNNIGRMDAMADTALETNDPERAAELYSKVIKLSPEDPDKKFNSFDKMINKGHTEQARALCKETTMPEEIVRHYNNKGVMHSKEGDPGGAMSSYEQALIFYPENRNNFRIHFNIALAHINGKKEGYVEKARKSLEKVLELNPEFEKAQNILTQINTPKKKKTQKKAS